MPVDQTPKRVRRRPVLASSISLSGTVLLLAVTALISLASPGTATSTPAADQPRGVPVFWDDFNRSDGAPGTAPNGQSYRLVPNSDVAGVVLPTIVSHKLVATGDPSAAAAYTGVALPAGTVPLRMHAQVTFAAGSPGGVAALISNRQGNDHVSEITAGGSVHIVFGTTYAQVGFFENNVYSTPATFSYSGIQQDGATVYTIGWTVVGYTIYMELPDGSRGQYRDARLQTYLGRYLTYENYWQTGQAHIQFVFIGAET